MSLETWHEESGSIAQRIPMPTFSPSEFFETRQATTPRPSGVEINTKKLSPGFDVSLLTFHSDQSLCAAMAKAERSIHFSCILKGNGCVSHGKRKSSLCRENILTTSAQNTNFELKLDAGFSNIEMRVDPCVLEQISGTDNKALCCLNGSDVFILNKCRNPHLMNVAKRLGGMLEGGNYCQLLIYSAALEFLSWHINTLHPHSCDTCICTRDRRKLMAARELLLSDLSNPPTIAQLSRETGINQLKIKKGFKIMFGNSVYALFQQERMEKAHSLLLENSVTETAMLLGYSNVSHFSSAFRRQFGILPRDIRRSKFSSPQRQPDTSS